MFDRIDEESYREGRAAFDAGASLRAMTEAAREPASEDRAFSALLGFADAALDKLRGIKR